MYGHFVLVLLVCGNKYFSQDNLLICIVKMANWNGCFTHRLLTFSPTIQYSHSPPQRRFFPDATSEVPSFCERECNMAEDHLNYFPNLISNSKFSIDSRYRTSLTISLSFSFCLFKTNNHTYYRQQEVEKLYLLNIDHYEIELCIIFATFSMIRTHQIHTLVVTDSELFCEIPSRILKF